MKRSISILALIALMMCLLPLHSFAVDTVPNFYDGDLSYKNVRISGIVWKYKSDFYADGSTTVNDAVTAEQIKNALDRGKGYGINYKMTWSGLTGKRVYDTKIVFISPDEEPYKYTYNCGRIEHSTNYLYRWWDCIGEHFFQWYYEVTGDILPGTYLVQLFFDDMLVNTTYLDVY